MSVSPVAKAIIAAALMAAASLAAHQLKPTQLLADTLPKLDLEQALPLEFGPWRQAQVAGGAVVNPQATSLVNALYSQVLNRVYVNTETNAYVMLSVAYGTTQADQVALHVPDACYPAQGFSLSQVHQTSLQLAGRSIRAKQAVATQGSRVEPLTYWTTIGSSTAISSFERKLAQLNYGLRGQIPDGLIVRVSSLDSDPVHAWKSQLDFLNGFAQAIHRGAVDRILGGAQ